MAKKRKAPNQTRASSTSSQASRPERGKLEPGPVTTEQPESPLSLQQLMNDTLTSSPGGISKAEILETGREAAELLSSPIFQDAQAMVLESITAAWLQSAEGETQLRESLWHRAQNLQGLTEMLNLAVNAAQQENLTDQELAERDLLRYQDEQGFGLDDLEGYQDHNGEGLGPLN